MNWRTSFSAISLGCFWLWKRINRRVQPTQARSVLRLRCPILTTFLTCSRSSGVGITQTYPMGRKTDLSCRLQEGERRDNNTYLVLIMQIRMIILSYALHLTILD